ncbi:MAG: hypothetical protein IPJ48_10305 [Propionivibrio sp.]|uniref:Uncharacterized protein n=1 Tax=Candidatus Propionivibrio dominans TaxID=2954373 RepID=A0A9D7FCP3_9RHOO|nr:hypothetical protein [Candidatus Propionivibrio dominans]
MLQFVGVTASVPAVARKVPAMFIPDQGPDRPLVGECGGIDGEGLARCIGHQGASVDNGGHRAIADIPIALQRDAAADGDRLAGAAVAGRMG